MRIILPMLALVVAAPAIAQDAAPAAAVPVAAEAKPAKPPKPKMICRPVAQSTGSRLGSARECHTAEDWKALNDSDVDTGGIGSGRTVRSETNRSQ